MAGTGHVECNNCGGTFNPRHPAIEAREVEGREVVLCPWCGTDHPLIGRDAPEENGEA